MSASADHAFGAPGIPPTWSSSDTDFVTAALDTTVTGTESMQMGGRSMVTASVARGLCSSASAAIWRYSRARMSALPPDNAALRGRWRAAARTGLGYRPDSSARARPGRPCGSAMPLVWAHVEFLKLLVALGPSDIRCLTPRVSRWPLRCSELPDPHPTVTGWTQPPAFVSHCGDERVPGIAHSPLVDGQCTGMEHRLGRRMPLTLPVRLERYGRPTAYGGLCNASLSGVYVETSLPFALFTRVDFVCGRLLYERIGVTHMSAFVSRVTSRGIAVQWFEFASAVIRRLAALAESTCPQLMQEAAGNGHERNAASRARAHPLGVA